MPNDTYREILNKWEAKEIIKPSTYDATFGEYGLTNKLGSFDRFPYRDWKEKCPYGDSNEYFNYYFC